MPLAILANAALAALLLTYTATTRLFLGRLRDAEVERVQDRLAGAAMETCLAMTVFRGEASVEAGALFACLAALKVLHWLAADRVAHLDSGAAPGGGGGGGGAGQRGAGLRLAGLLALLLVSLREERSADARRTGKERAPSSPNPLSLIILLFISHSI